jgi:DNA-binding transcriptional LysR family regulator
MYFDLGEYMDLKRLETFALLAKYGSLPRTAAQLKLSSAAVSIRLKKLEKEIGVRLFDRYPNKLVLTDRGKVFSDELKQVFVNLNHAVLAASEAVEDSTRCSISLANDISKFFLPEIGKLIKRKLDLRITLLLCSSAKTLSLVQSKEVDFGIGRFSHTPATLNRTKLFDDSISLIFPAHSASRWRHRVRLPEIATQRLCLLTRNAATRKLIDAAFLSKNIVPDHVIEVSTCQAAMEFVRLGVGIGLIHSFCASAVRDKELGYVDLRRFFGRTEISLIYNSRMHLTPTHVELIRALTHK